MRLTRGFVVTITALALVTIACGKSGDTDDGAALEHGSARRGPGKLAREVCEPMIREAVEFEVGLPLAGEPVAAVAGDRFSCRYEFAGGTLGMSVRDLKQRPKAQAYFDELLADGGATVERLPGLGDDSFLTEDAKLVLIKDAMVLMIDPTSLPPLPPTAADRPTIAIDLGTSVMGCWPG